LGCRGRRKEIEEHMGNIEVAKEFGTGKDCFPTALTENKIESCIKFNT